MCVRHFVDLEVVADELNSVLKAVPKSRIATSINKLVIIHEQPLRAADTVIATDVIGPPVLAVECTLHAMLQLCQVELMRCQSLPHLLEVACFVLRLPLGEVLHRRKLIFSVRHALFLALHHDIVMSYFSICTNLYIL